jgi:hypothetical protein
MIMVSGGGGDDDDDDGVRKFLSSVTYHSSSLRCYLSKFILILPSKPPLDISSNDHDKNILM